MIFKFLKWSAIIKLVMTVKPYFRIIIITTAMLWLVDALHQEIVNFLKDTNNPGMISYTYFTKWVLILVVALFFIYRFRKNDSVLHSVFFIYRINKIGEGNKFKTEQPIITPPTASQHKHLLTKDKLMSKGDKILKK